MKLILSELAQNAQIEAVAKLIDAGGAAGRIELTTKSGELLSVLKFSYPSYTKPSKGILQFAPIADDEEARRSGRAERAIIVSSNGTVVFECDVSNTDGDGAIQLNNNDIKAGGPVRIKYARFQSRNKRD